MPFGAPFPGSLLSRTLAGTATGPASSFTGVNFGTAFAGRYLVVTGGGTATIGQTGNLTCTIGGVSATLVASVAQNASTVETNAFIFIALVPTGTSGTVSFGGAGGISVNSIALYSLAGLSSATPDNTQTQGSASNNLSQVVTVKAGGAVFAVATVNGSSGSFTWTGVNSDQQFGPSGSIASSEASASDLAAQSLTVSVSVTGTRGWALAVASFH